MPKKTTKKAPPSKARKAEINEAQRVLNSVVRSPGFNPQAFANGLTEALFGFNPGSVGAQLSQSDTLFVNLRGYLISNNRQLMSQIYTEMGTIKSAIDVPVDDALRGDVNFTSKQLSPEQLETLKTYYEQENVLHGAVGQGERWNRLYGGGGILPILPQNPETPLVIESIKQGSRCKFRACDMWELYYDKQASENYEMEPSPLDDPTHPFYRYYGQSVHKSRVMRLMGIEAPSWIRPRLRGWGMSITETMVRSVNQYLKSTNVAFEVLDEFKVDIFQLDGLNDTMQNAGGTAAVHERVRLTNRSKNYLNAMVLDSKDKYEQKQLTFSGLADVMREIRMQVASDLRMPMTKLFGMSAQGFSSGEDDLENYNGMVESEVRMKIKRHIIKTAMICCQILFGSVPSDLGVEFAALRVLSSKDQEDVKDKQFNRLTMALDKGLITKKQWNDAVNKSKLLPVQVDPDQGIELVTVSADEGDDGREDRE